MSFSVGIAVSESMDGVINQGGSYRPSIYHLRDAHQNKWIALEDSHGIEVILARNEQNDRFKML